MPAITRKGDTCTGHGGWPPRASVEGTSRFTVSGSEAHLEGHAWAAHTNPSIPETHAGTLASGAPRFTIGGLQVGRVGDPVDCGSSVATGEDRFTIGD